MTGHAPPAAPRAVPDWFTDKWQSLVDTMAELADVPAGLVMRVVGDDIEVLVSSRTIGNPYRPGEALRLPDSGLYCETVIRSAGLLAVPDALADAAWRDNPDIALGMVSYLGVPIRWPDAAPFGTLCILDDKARSHSALVERLLVQFRDMIEHHLGLIDARTEAELERQADRHRLGEALRSSEQRFRLLVDQAGDEFLLHDETGRILDANASACRGNGLDRTTLLATPLGALPIRFGDSWTTRAWAAARAGKTGLFEARRLDRDGAATALELRWSCQLMQGDKLFLLLARDVTERRRAEDAARAAEAELARASRLLAAGQLAGSIIHEVNQPLAAIAARAAACLRWLDREPPSLDQARRSARSLASSAHEAAAVVGVLRALAERGSPGRTLLDLHAVIDDALALTRRECDRAGVTRTVRRLADAAMVEADPTQLRLVLLNLVSNAVEAMRGADPSDRHLLVATERADDGVAVTLEDGGAGFGDVEAERLFDPMFTTRPHGMGMGLAICRTVIQAHGGRIWAEPCPSRTGTRLGFWLPAASTRGGDAVPG